MRSYLIFLFISTYLFQQHYSINLEIVHYNNVTQETCGLKKLRTQSKSCIQYRQTIRDELALMKSIKDGGYAETGEFPFSALIRTESHSNYTSHCSGSIINSKWIITAGHCLLGIKTIKVYIGTDYPQDLENFIEAQQYFLHVNYSQLFKNKRYDLGLIKLKEEVQIRDEVNSVCLPSPKLSMETIELATFCGWGAINEDPINTHRLKKTPIKLTDKFSKNNFWITSRETIDGVLCSGDSGGPLIQYLNGRAVLIGTLMGTEREFGTMCGKPTSTWFVSVVHNLKWIRETILKH